MACPPHACTLHIRELWPPRAETTALASNPPREPGAQKACTLEVFVLIQLLNQRDGGVEEGGAFKAFQSNLPKKLCRGGLVHELAKRVNSHFAQINDKPVILGDLLARVYYTLPFRGAAALPLLPSRRT